MAWPDSRLGEFGPINQKIAVARTEAVDAPDIFISPASGPSGQQVTLQGFAFQPDLGVFVQLGDSTISQLRTNDNGEFTASIFMPITSEGPQTISVFDESGNFARTDYFTDFGFGNIADAIEDLGEKVEALEAADAGADSDGS